MRKVGIHYILGCALAALTCLAWTPSAYPALVGYWAFDGTANDLSGNGNTLALNNGAGLTTGGTGHSGQAGDQAVNFDGSNDYANNLDGGGNNKSYDIGTSSFSISLWVDPDHVGAFRGLLDHEKESPLEGYQIFMLTDGKLRIAVSDTGPDRVLLDSDAAIGAGDGWHHVAFTIDKSNSTGGKTYIDGVLQTTVGDFTSIDDISNTRNFLVGAANSTNFFDGQLDDLAIFTDVLTPQQVGAMFHQSHTPLNVLTIPEPSTLAIWVLGLLGLAWYSRWRRKT